MKGMKTYLALSLVALAGIVGLAVLSRKIDRLQQQVERLEHRSKESATKTRVQELEQQVVEVQERADRALPRTEKPEQAAAREEAGQALAVTDEQLQQIVEKKVQEQLEKQPKDNGWGGKKLPLQTIADDLKLDPATQAAMADVVNVAKQEAFDLLKTQREDGSSLADEIMDAFTKGGDQAQELAQKSFMKIFSDKVPGTDETYLQAMLQIQERAHAGLQRILPPDQYMRYKHTGVEPLDVETGFDPWTEYFKKK